MNPNNPIVVRVAEYSTKVMACRASAFRLGGTISVSTPLLAGADPDASGSKEPTRVVSTVTGRSLTRNSSGVSYQDTYASLGWQRPRMQ
jgi:hypothetical protein